MAETMQKYTPFYNSVVTNKIVSWDHAYVVSITMHALDLSTGCYEVGLEPFLI